MSSIEQSNLTLDMIPDGVYHLIAQRIGVDNLLKLADVVGGNTFYVPLKASLLREVRNNQILREFDGGNFRELSLKYGISDRMIRKIVKNHKGGLNGMDITSQADRAVPPADRSD